MSRLRADPPNIDPRTVQGFGEEWTAYDQSRLDSAEHQYLFDTYFSCFPFDDLPPDAVGFDLGCGSGRWARLMAPRVGHLHCIDPSGKALEVARRLLAPCDNVSFHLAGVDSIPLPDGSQDFGYTLGVLHHIPNTAQAMASCVAKLKPGAPLLVYLYYSFDNRPAWFRLLWKVSDFARLAISRLPFRLRRPVTVATAALVYLPLARIARGLELLGANVSAFPLSAYRRLSFYTMRTDALDRLGTPLEQRFSRAEIQQMMEECGLTDIVFRDDVPHWVARGRKRVDGALPIPHAATTQPAESLAAASPSADQCTKIVHVVPSLSRGGGERVVVDLANWEASNGQTVTILAGAKVDENLLRHDLRPEVEVRYLGGASRLGRYITMLPWLWRNRKWLAEQDVVHCHMTFSAALGTVAYLAKRFSRAGKPIIVETYHAVGMAIPRSHRWLHARMASCRDGIALMAEDPYWSGFIKARPRLPSAVIPNGIVIERPKVAPDKRLAYRRELGIPDSCTAVVGTIGRLQAARRPWLYPRIFAEIASRAGPDVHFLIGGEGPELERVKAAIAAEGLEGRVHMPGLVRAPSLPLSVLDLYLTLNVGPITGIAALEAAASGLPILAVQFVESYQPSEADWIWSSTNLEEIGRRAADLLADRDALRELAKRQKAYVRANRTVEAMANAYRALYKAAAAA